MKTKRNLENLDLIDLRCNFFRDSSLSPITGWRQLKYILNFHPELWGNDPI